ncbi:MAG TPA: 50S ribosomal protein L18 [Candidatus Aenigmarchaeota archaeon]|nr:MAG: 50S ribosomal protein L18 [Candidatus Aenigmarchaeota archaeon]HDD46392.1 50S ribosomal protein L18 [Candidatus Aenigmarchaeota archaeon]
MGKGKTYIIPHRRRREGRTDYRKRLRLLKSHLPRFVVRKSLNNIICQIIEFMPKGDKVIVSADSKELKKFGWLGNCGNIPAAYLTGLLCGLRAKKKGIERSVLDIGMYRSVKGSRIYGALKGALDAGISIPHSPDILPKEERIKGMHISNYAKKLKKENMSKYKKMFANYIKKNVDVENLDKVFEAVKNKISKAFS